MKGRIIKTVKLALAAGLVAVSVTGCCLWSDKKDCCGKDGTCCTERHSHGVGMSASIGTDGVKAGCDAK